MKTQAFPWLLFGMLLTCPATAADSKSTVQVRGVGTVTVPSDVVVLRLSATTSHIDLQEAKRRNDQITAPIYQLAESRQIPRPTVQATNTSFDFVPQQPADKQQQGYGAQQLPGNYPQQGYNAPNSNPYPNGKGGKGFVPNGRPEPPEPPIHFSRNLELKFNNLNQAVACLAEIVKWDCVRTTCELRLAPLGFDVADREKHLSEARRRAVASAKERAQLLAEQNGLKLGPATSIFDESSDAVLAPGGYVPGSPYCSPHADPFAVSEPPAESQAASPVMRLTAMQKERAEKLDLDQIPPAQITVTAAVRIEFEISKP